MPRSLRHVASGPREKPKHARRATSSQSEHDACSGWWQFSHPVLASLSPVPHPPPINITTLAPTLQLKQHRLSSRGLCAAAITTVHQTRSSEFASRSAGARSTGCLLIVFSASISSTGSGTSITASLGCWALCLLTQPYRNQMQYVA